jgi:DedD protein
MAKKLSKKLDVNYKVSLKHRLIGAGILISFGVVILPWLLGSYSSEQLVEENGLALKENTEIKKTETPSTKIKEVSKPKSEVKIFVSRVQPLNKSPDNSTPKQVIQKPKEAPKVKPKNVAVKTEKKVKTTVAPKSVKSEPKSTSKIKVTPKPIPKKTETKIERGYIVSVGLFGNTKNVDKMLSDLRSKKFQPSVRKEKFNSKTVSRVFMGPFATRAEAGKIKLKLSEKENIPSLIKEFP